MAREEEQPRQRLILCLDGTWNRRDSGTNVYHLSNLIARGDVSSDGQPWRQHVSYQQGVGTGVLDSVTGGAFGIGLSQNVRKAYDWLVETYRDGDEIYVFGFSRGAFTARSLVGLISKCGLLRRGAPLPPEELWHGYQILGRLRDPRTGMEPDPSWWELLRGKPKAPFQELKTLRRESWETSPSLELHEPANRAERLLKEWSRRVPIQCIGVFDTVGALGVNALAIPWLRDHTAQFHDARLNTLVVNGFHALAIDEYRASFVHIPWFEACGAGGTLPQGQTVKGGRIEQRWFVGAHSNVGGGYEDDVLSQHALAWMIDETRKLGLVFREREAADPDPAQPSPVAQTLPLLATVSGVGGLADQAPAVRDSYSEFAGGIWKHLIRAKREYRRMEPPPELQNGQTVQSLNEKLDPSVAALAAADPSYNPPHLWLFRQKEGTAFEATKPTHRYSEAGWRWWAGLALWLALIAIAGWKFGGWLDRRYGALLGAWSWRWLAGVAPAIALLVDWRESVLNHATTLEPDGPRAEKRLAWMDWYLGIRLVAIAAAAAGLIILAFELAWPWLWRDLPPVGPLSPFLKALVVLDVLWIYFQSAMAWNGGPMTDAGLGSIVKLQRQRSPKKVLELLAHWAGGDRTVGGRQVLMPVVRSLWRDMLGFIPAYTVFLFVGSWLALSLVRFHFVREPLPIGFRQLFSTNPRLWIPVLAGALLCAFADCVEDWSELRFLRAYPQAPAPGAVRLANAATGVKLLLFGAGFALTVAATLGLVIERAWGIWSRRAGTLSLLAALFALALLFTGVKSLFAKSASTQD